MNAPAAAPREVRDTPMPPQIAALPRHESGYPIPYFVAWVDGRPDLKLLDQAKQIRCAKFRLCGICGQPVGYWIAFIGGPLTVANRVCTDPGMHEECARYAIAVCPFMARPNARRAAHHHPLSEAGPGHVAERPERTALYITRQYTPFTPDSRNILLRLAPAKRIEWFGGDA